MMLHETRILLTLAITFFSLLTENTYSGIATFSLPKDGYHIKGSYEYVGQRRTLCDSGNFVLDFCTGKVKYGRFLRDTPPMGLPASTPKQHEEYLLSDKYALLCLEIKKETTVTYQADVYSLTDLSVFHECVNNVTMPVNDLTSAVSNVDQMIRAYERFWKEKSRGLYVFDTKMATDKSMSDLRPLTIELRTDTANRVVEVTRTLEANLMDHTILSYADEVGNGQFPAKFETTSSRTGMYRMWNIDELTTSSACAEVISPLYLQPNTVVIDHRTNPPVRYVTKDSCLLPDDRLISMAIAAKDEEAVVAAQAKAAAASAVASNDPHNIKNVPVTGESWGKRLRRVPNWAYGGAVVLFLGGWVVAASRRKRR